MVADDLQRHQFFQNQLGRIQVIERKSIQAARKRSTHQSAPGAVPLQSSSYPIITLPLKKRKNCACGIGKPFQDILEALLVIRQVYQALP